MLVNPPNLMLGKTNAEIGQCLYGKTGIVHLIPTEIDVDFETY